MPAVSARAVAKTRAARYENGMNDRRVLVVDDDDDIRALVVLDVSMPEMDGWQTLERIRDLSEVPVLMLTARGAELERVRGLQAGADDYVTKPFGRQEP